MGRVNNKGGMIRTVVFIVVALLVLSFMGISVREVAQSKAGQDNFNYAKVLVVAIWSRYLAEPAKYLYHDIFLNLIWSPFVEALRDLKDDKPTSIDPQNVDYSRARIVQ